MTLALYGHRFSSYSWKGLIALYAKGIPFEFREVGPEHPEHEAFVQAVHPQGKFPVLLDGEAAIFEATSIIEHLALHHPGSPPLIPADPAAAAQMRMLDRVFDNYVMNVMQIVVEEYLRDPGNPDAARCQEARERLTRSYLWLEGWLEDYPLDDRITLVECAAAPSLFYADWVQPITADFPRLKAWRAHFLSLPPVKRCVEDARPYRHLFPLGAPERD